MNRFAPAVIALTLLASGARAEPLSAAAGAAIDASIAKTLAPGSPGAAVEVTRDGKVVFAKGYGIANLEDGAPVSGDTVFKLASVTKQFTAAAVLLMVEDGKLKLDDRVAKYVPELSQAEQLTVYQLLVQTSGLPDYADDPAGQASRSVRRTPTEMVAWIGRLTPAFQFEPGTAWAYSNSNYVLLGLVVERVSGKPLADVFRERLFQPAGLIHTAFDDPTEVVPHRAQGYRRDAKAAGGFANADWISPTVPGPAGGLRTTADDLARWSDALFAGRVLKQGSLAIMTAPGRLNDGRTTRWGMPEDWRKGLDADYGMGLFVTRHQGRRVVWHSGDIDGFSTWLAHFPDDHVSIALLQNSQSADFDKDAIETAVFSGR